MTIHVAIGNSDDKLSQREWSCFWSDTQSVIGAGATSILGAWLSIPGSQWQNAAWAFEAEEDERALIRSRLIELAEQYGQDSIAWNESETEFLGAPDGL